MCNGWEVVSLFWGWMQSSEARRQGRRGISVREEARRGAEAGAALWAKARNLVLSLNARRSLSESFRQRSAVAGFWGKKVCRGAG